MDDDLTIPNEPLEIKKKAQIEKTKVDWNMDSLIAWSGNSLPKYLWTTSNWGTILKKRGYNWQHFLKILSFHKKEIICWLRDDISWEDLVKKIKKTIDETLGELVKRS
jgi:hypothetical protein